MKQLKEVPPCPHYEELKQQYLNHPEYPHVPCLNLPKEDWAELEYWMFNILPAKNRFTDIEGNPLFFGVGVKIIEVV